MLLLQSEYQVLIPKVFASNTYVYIIHTVWYIYACTHTLLAIFDTTELYNRGSVKDSQIGEIYFLRVLSFKAMIDKRLFDLCYIIIINSKENSNLYGHREMALEWMPQNIIKEKSILVQVIARCPQATSHYLKMHTKICVAIWCHQTTMS